MNAGRTQGNPVHTVDLQALFQRREQYVTKTVKPRGPHRAASNWEPVPTGLPKLFKTLLSYFDPET